ncbi:XRE family transcriptional regulator [Actinomadura sp. KC345]|nr:XRE family transcriptional regulator [Actinomadura sp. KC345]
MAELPTVRRLRLGAELRRLREGLGFTAEDIASRLDWSPSKISRIETAKIGVRVSDVRLLLELYQVGEGHMGEILALAQAATQRGWWDGYRHTLPERFAAYVALEDEASAAFLYSTYSVPALLQTSGVRAQRHRDGAYGHPQHAARDEAHPGRSHASPRTAQAARAARLLRGHRRISPAASGGRPWNNAPAVGVAGGDGRAAKCRTVRAAAERSS